MYSRKYKLIAKTLHNLEDVLASELQALGAEEVEQGRRAVSFLGDKALLYKANLRLRTALRILKPIHSFRAKNADELYAELIKFDWSQIMTVKQSFSIDTTVFSDVFTHSKYVGYKAKDALVDYWRQKSNQRPNVSLDAPDIYINIHIAQTEVTLSLDSSGDSLHKRGYRSIQTDAPINEVLAAGILLKAGWDGLTDLIDPMCGSGTFLIEAALIARNIAPGIYRKSFAFEQWLDYDADLFESIYNDDSQERSFECKIYGSDILSHAIRVSDENIRRAGLSKDIELKILPFEQYPKPQRPALIVMNPPYGERLRLSASETFYAMIGERLKHQFSGCKAWVIAYKSEHFHSIGLKSTLRLDMMNGALPCELRGYELFEGKHKAFKKSDKTIFTPNKEVSELRLMSSSEKRTFRKAYFTKGATQSGRLTDKDKKQRARKSNQADCKATKPQMAKKKTQLWPNDRFAHKSDRNTFQPRVHKPKIQVFYSEDK